MRLTTTAYLGLVLLALPAAAMDKPFRGIVGDAANIEHDAAAIRDDLKPSNFDAAKVKADIARLGDDIAKLRKDVEAIDGQLSEMSPSQKTNWELVKTKVQLLTIFHDRKSDLLQGDLAKNRSLIRAHADGIAKRAQMLQQTASKLDR